MPECKFSGCKSGVDCWDKSIDTKAMWVEDLEERHDPSGKPYYWLTGYFKDQDHKEDTDEWALKNVFP